MPAGYRLNVAAVRARMAACRFTHARLAAELGITRAGATNILSGNQRISLDRAARLARALRTIPQTVIEDHPEPRVNRHRKNKPRKTTTKRTPPQ